MFSTAQDACDNAKSTYFTISSMDPKAYKVVGLAKYQPNNGEPFKMKSVFGVVNPKRNEVDYLSMELEDGSRFDLCGSLFSNCCESFGYHFGLPTSNRRKWDDVTPSFAKLSSVDPSTPGSDEATTIYVCEITRTETWECDSSIIAFTDNPLIPLIAFYNYHNGYYSHEVKWSFTGPDGQELVADGTSI
jgi:hypothetical protein